MAYDAQDARRQLLGDVARAADELTAALGALGDAYELLDDATADRLEAELFGPVQAALARARRTASGFAQRTGLEAPPAPAPAVAGHPSQGVAGFVAAAVELVGEAELTLSELQDSMRPVEVGDRELRADLSATRQALADVPARARAFARTLGR